MSAAPPRPGPTRRGLLAGLAGLLGGALTLALPRPASAAARAARGARPAAPAARAPAAAPPPRRPDRPRWIGHC